MKVTSTEDTTPRSLKSHLRSLTLSLLRDVEEEAEGWNRQTDCMICWASLEAVVPLGNATRRILELLGSSTRAVTYHVFYEADTVQCKASGHGYEKGVKVFRIERPGSLLGFQYTSSRYAILRFNDQFD